MTDYTIDPKWAEDQLTQAGVTDERSQQSRDVRNGVMLMVLQFNAISASPIDKLEVLDIFNKLSQKQELVGRDVQSPDAHWTALELGSDIRPGTTVRVRSNAYDGKAGENHNGKVGKYIGARGGQVIVQYAGSADGTGHRHDPAKLEALVAR